MNDSPRVRFTLADVMLLIAGTAPGLILLRMAASLGLFKPASNASSLPPGREFIEHLTVSTGCVLLPLALLVLVRSLLDRTHPRREIVQGAGFIACLAVVLSVIIQAAYFTAAIAMSNEYSYSTELTLNFFNSFGRLNSEAGPMIVGAWLALVLTRGWRFSPTWSDRLGCLIGACFVMIYLYVHLYFIVMPFLR